MAYPRVPDLLIRIGNIDITAYVTHGEILMDSAIGVTNPYHNPDFVDITVKMKVPRHLITVSAHQTDPKLLQDGPKALPPTSHLTESPDQ